MMSFGRKKIGDRSDSPKSLNLAMTATVFGVGLGAFFLATNFLGDNSVQFSPGESVNIFGWQFYSALALILIGIIGIFFWIKGSKTKKVVKKSFKKVKKKKKR